MDLKDRIRVPRLADRDDDHDFPLVLLLSHAQFKKVVVDGLLRIHVPTGRKRKPQ